jgi:hypothetical protein
MQLISTPSHRISLESPTGHIILFSLALVLNVQPELFTFVAILDNSQSGHLGHIFLAFVHSLVSLFGAVFNDQVDKRELHVPLSLSVAGVRLESLLKRRQSFHISCVASQALGQCHWCHGFIFIGHSLGNLW